MRVLVDSWYHWSVTDPLPPHNFMINNNISTAVVWKSGNIREKMMKVRGKDKLIMYDRR